MDSTRYRTTFILPILLILALGFTACEGPTGDPGPQGPAGPAGAVGPAGDDGSVMYAGTGAPTEDVGNTGDYYLNQNTGQLYGPKEAEGWGEPILLLMGQDGEDGTIIHSGNGAPENSIGVVGDFYIDVSQQDLYGPKTESGWGDAVDLGSDGSDGEDGEDGSQIFSGDAPPAASLGVEGDYYLNVTNQDLYGPKTGSGWGSPISLSGEDGEDGDDGQPGEDGEDGNTILSGSGAPENSIGAVGDFYIDVNTQNLYGPKTDSGWGSPVNLNGEDGEDGENGSQIYSGEGPPAASLGAEGDYYVNDTNQDLYGPKTGSSWGSPISLSGDDGADGADGEDGNTILSGDVAPDNSIGVVGDFYLNTANYDLYGPKTESGWGSPVNLQGPPGNANVTLYIFGIADFAATTSVSKTINFNVITETEMLESGWQVYLKQGDTYYHLPGRGSTDIGYKVSHSWVPAVGAVFTITEHDISGMESYEEVHIVQTAAANVNNDPSSPAKAIPTNLDFSDYHSVVKYYGLTEENAVRLRSN